MTVGGGLGGGCRDRGSHASDRLLVGAIVLAVIRMAVQGLTNHPRFFVGLVSVALSIAVLTQAVGRLAARRLGGRAAGAAVALGAGFGVGLQLALGTWDAFWREGPVGWVVTTTVVGAMVAAAVVVRRDPTTTPVAPAGRVWVLGPTLSLLAMTLGNAAFAASQSDVWLAIAGLQRSACWSPAPRCPRGDRRLLLGPRGRCSSSLLRGSNPRPAD